MTRLTRADFENMTLVQLAKLCVASKTDLGLSFTGHVGLVSNESGDMISDMTLIGALTQAAQLGWFDSAQPFPAVAHNPPSDSIPVGSEGDSSNESKVP